MRLFSKLKAILRKASERTIDGLWNTIGRAIDQFTLQSAPVILPLPVMSRNEQILL